MHTYVVGYKINLDQFSEFFHISRLIVHWKWNTSERIVNMCDIETENHCFKFQSVSSFLKFFF